jgi:hypothetical protein
MSVNNMQRNQGMWASLCTPAKLYGMISVVGVAGLLYNQELVMAMGQALFAILWIFILNWICSEGWPGLSWFLVFLPIIVGMILLMMSVSAIISAAEGNIPRRMY